VGIELKIGHYKKVVPEFMAEIGLVAKLWVEISNDFDNGSGCFAALLAIGEA
jgi:hypothetical protein